MYVACFLTVNVLPGLEPSPPVPLCRTACFSCDATLLRAVLRDARESHGHAAAVALANLQDTLGETPLHRAVEAAWEDGALLLIDAGARCELASLSRTSPLHAAAYAGMLAVCQRILDAAAAASTPSATAAEAGSAAAVLDLVRMVACTADSSQRWLRLTSVALNPAACAADVA